MYKDNDEILEEAKKSYDNIEIPENISDYIKEGINEGKRIKRKSIRRKVIGIAAGFLLIVLFSSIRISPSFADFLSQIPGFEYIVKLVNYDKGLKLAVENEFIQHIGASDEHEDLVFTVEDIIVDEGRMVVFYSLLNKGDHKYVNLKKIDFLDGDGNQLEFSFSWAGFIRENMNENKKLNGKIDVNIGDHVSIPDNIKMTVNLEEAKETWEEYHLKHGSEAIDKKHDPEEGLAKELESTWEVNIPIDKEKFKNLKEIYDINKEIEVAGQKIYFKKLILNPTRIGIDIEYDNDNTMKIFEIHNLRVLDESGEVFTRTGGITGSYIDENTTRLYLESNYFNKPKEIYIVADGIQGLDKDKLTVKVDLDRGELLNRPDEKLVLEEINTNNINNLIEVQFGLKTEDPKRVYGVFDYTFVDANGKEHKNNGVGSGGSDEEYNNKIYFNLDNNEDYASPITLTINQYPNILEDNIKIKVK